MSPVTRGDPESPLRWTCKSTQALAGELFVQHEIRVSDKTVAKLLKEHGYSLQAPSKSVEGTQHPDRNAQFEHINAKAEECLERGVPVLSVDTKKKELVGNFKNSGREWQPEGEPELVDVHDFPSDAVGKAIPYGVYDVGANDGFVSVGIDHDTPVFAVTTIEAWWVQVGAKRYRNAREIFITADAGGSNSYRSRVWKYELQRVADKLGLMIHVCHFPPGTSKWNKVEHRLFSFISINWRGRPLRSYETVVNLISNTTNRGGLVVRARLDRRKYPIGKKVSVRGNARPEYRAPRLPRRVELRRPPAVLEHLTGRLVCSRALTTSARPGNVEDRDRRVATRAGATARQLQSCVRSK